MTRTIAVEGMSCGHCEQTVEEALREIRGVTDASADHESGRATVDGDPDVTELVQAVEEAGYTAETGL